MHRNAHEPDGKLVPDPVELEGTTCAWLGVDGLDLQSDELDFNPDLLQSGAERDNALPIHARDLDVGGSEIEHLHGRGPPPLYDARPMSSRRTPK